MDGEMRSLCIVIRNPIPLLKKPSDHKASRVTVFQNSTACALTQHSLMACARLHWCDSQGIFKDTKTVLTAMIGMEKGVENALPFVGFLGLLKNLN